jgi:glutathione-independent formaldehyde dehydrogenase
LLISSTHGPGHDRRYTTQFRDLITSGRARPGAIVTHRGTLDDAPELYRRFDRREHGIIKAVIQP